MNKIHGILIEADPYNSLGGSCLRDIHNMSKALAALSRHTVAKTYIITTREVKNQNDYPRSIRPLFIQSKQFRTEIRTIIQSNQKRNKACKFFIYISGHGYHTVDTSGDEMNGMDEYIVMNDGMVLDDHLYMDIVAELRLSDSMFALIDTCHSGSMFDLDYRLNYPQNVWKKFTKRKPLSKHAYSISACKDAQMASCDIGQRTGYGGALTVHFLDHNLLPTFLSGDFMAILRILVPQLKKLNQTPECCTSDQQLL